MSTLQLRIFDGSRTLFADPVSFLVRIVDGNQKQQHWQEHRSNSITFDLPFFDNLGDRYTVVVSADGYRQAGYYPVKLSTAYKTMLDVMLVRNAPGFNFADARWPAAKARYPFLSGNGTDAMGAQRYEDLLDRTPKSLASILNLGEAMGQIHLPEGTPLNYLKQLRWDPPLQPAPDRFFAWCDVALVDQVRRSAAEGKFAPENAPQLLHPGATASWKQVQFGEANVQLTFHEGDRARIGGMDCVIVEPDMDYFRDPLAHTIFEVLPNALTHTLTEPAEVYVLRWIAGRTAGIPEFAPLYTLT